MLNQEQNERVCRVEPGTAMGEVFRRFWLPVCASDQIRSPDSDPLRVRLLGQWLIAFRDSHGAAGVLDEQCPHRGASLALGRVEQGGIRCLYHGWKFDRNGKLLDAPNCSRSGVLNRLAARSYPVREEGGIVWGYLGPGRSEPPFTRYAFMDAPASNRVVVRIDVDCNYLQLTEGGFDSSHVGILHSDAARPGWMNSEFSPNLEADHPGALSVHDNDPELEVSETDFGFYYAAFRRASQAEDPSGRLNVRVVPFIMPSTRIIPSATTSFIVFETPADYEHTSTFIVVYGSKPVDRARVISILGIDDARYWSEEDCRFRASWETRFGQNRAQMKSNWTGLRGLEQEDAVMSLSMGPVVDRSREHLVASDRAVASLRKLLLRSAGALEQGEDITLPEDLTDVGAVDTYLAERERAAWRDLMPSHELKGERGKP